MLTALAMLLLHLRRLVLGAKAGDRGVGEPGSTAMSNLSICSCIFFMISFALVAEYRNSLDPRTALTPYEKLLFVGGTFDAGFFGLVIGFLFSGVNYHLYSGRTE